MAGGKQSAKYFVRKGTGELIALSQGNGSCLSSLVQTGIQRAASSSNEYLDPSDLYASFSWKVDNPSQLYINRINSPVFSVCGTQWVIWTCPDPEKEQQMSLFLYVANHDVLLPGWSQYAQFTVSTINENPLKSFHLDAFHRFSKSEPYRGWRDCTKLDDLVDGFMIGNTVEFRIQIQLIREKPHPLTSSIERRYRRELFCGMAFDMETASFDFLQEQKATITNFVNHTAEFTRFGSFYMSLDKRNRGKLSQDRTDSICAALVKRFIKREDTKTALLVEMLYLGMGALVTGAPRNNQIVSVSNDASATFVSVKNGMFIMAEDIFKLLNSILGEERPWYYEGILQIKERRNVEDLRDEYPFQEEAIFAGIGRLILEAFSIVHILREKIYPEYLLHLSLKKQKELLEELDAEQEKKLKNHQRSKKSNKKSKKQKDKIMISKPETSDQQDAGDAQVGEHSDQLCGVTIGFHQVENVTPAIEDKILEEPLTSNATSNLESHMNDLSIEQSDTPWTRKERKKTKATRTSMKPPRESHQTRGSSSKERKEPSSKRELGGNQGEYKGNFRKSQVTEHLKDEKIEAVVSQSTISKTSRVVDMSQKSWADFHLGFTFGSSTDNIPSSDLSEEDYYPYMNMINYIMEGEF